MEIQRTANAGVLLKIDGVSILLDGLADGVEGYLPTPDCIADRLLENPPDVLVFTHYHPDHCSEALLLPYRKQNLRPILGPESLYSGTVRVGDITITPIVSRHLGKTEPGLEHVSYIIKGSRCVWFTGDAAPLQWRDRMDLPRPDLVIAPYAYANTESALKLVSELTDCLILLHLPQREKDPYGLWKSIESTLSGKSDMKILIPEIGTCLKIQDK